MPVLNYIKAQKDWPTPHNPSTEALYLNPHERISPGTDVCTFRFYAHIEKLNDAVPEYLHARFGRRYYYIIQDT